MGNYSKSVLLAQCFNATLKGTPTPNTGISFADVSPYVCNDPSAVLFTQLSPTLLRMQWAKLGSYNVTIKSKNASGVEFTDVITVAVSNPTPDATDSGIELGSAYYI